MHRWKIGVTGACGLLGFHVRACLHACSDISEVRLATRETFLVESTLDEFGSGLDAIIHCAGVNRGEEKMVEKSNIDIAQALVQSLQRTGSTPVIVYANSTHEARDTAYGRGKRRGAQIFQQWGESVGVAVGNFVLPHVFGEFGKPFYNSVTSTFCYQLARDEEPRIDVDGELELVHAQDVARQFIDWIFLAQGRCETIRIEGRCMRVSELLAHLRKLLARYRQEGIIPNLQDPLALRLFKTLRSYLYPELYPRPLRLHADARGSLFEAVKADQGGQSFLSTTFPGVTRGNHWHLRKIELFLVVGGRGAIHIRKLFCDEVQSFEVNGETPVYIDIPTMHTHCIKNIGDAVLQTLFWSNEIFDPNDPDTFPEAVLP